VSAAVLAVERGAQVVRVHDVKETAQAICVWQALKAASV
jgi:dihydropteroate synthase